MSSAIWWSGVFHGGIPSGGLKMHAFLLFSCNLVILLGLLRALYHGQMVLVASWLSLQLAHDQCWQCMGLMFCAWHLLHAVWCNEVGWYSVHIAHTTWWEQQTCWVCPHFWHREHCCAEGLFIQGLILLVSWPIVIDSLQSFFSRVPLQQS